MTTPTSPLGTAIAEAETALRRYELATDRVERAALAYAAAKAKTAEMIAARDARRSR